MITKQDNFYSSTEETFDKKELGSNSLREDETAHLKSTLSLRSASFRKNREHNWIELEKIIDHIDKKGIASVSLDEAQNLPLLYRSAISSLSVARSIVLDRHLILYLETLVLRGYLAVYGPRTGIIDNLQFFFTKSFPYYVFKARWHLLFTICVFFVGIAGGMSLVRYDPSYFSIIVPQELAGGRGPFSTAEELWNGELFAPWPGFIDSFIVFANSLFTHNTVVGILCFCLGVFAGIPTVLLLIYQGLIVGAFLEIHYDKGLLIHSVGWLSIHGVTELLAIFLCGTGGLIVAEKLLFPGELPRLESLVIYGRRAATIAAGSILLFFVAGILEGGVRQLVASTPLRFLIAFITGAFWFFYFALGNNISLKE